MPLTKSASIAVPVGPREKKQKFKRVTSLKHKDFSMITVNKIADELDLPVETLLLSGLPACTFHDLLLQSEKVKLKIDAIKDNLARMQKLIEYVEKN